MRTNYDKQLDKLHEELILMGGMCEKAIALAIKALTDSNEKLIPEVYSTDNGIDQKEKEIESMCMRLLLQQHPVAGDLRTVSAALKMISDIERIGDQASDIAEIAEYIIKNGQKPSHELSLMAKEAIYMVTSAIDSFVRADLTLTEKVIAHADRVDALCEKIGSDVVESIKHSGEKAKYYIDIIMIAKYLERIADHATNICEWVRYTVTGVHITD